MNGWIFVRVADLVESGWVIRDGRAHLKLSNGAMLCASEDNAPGVVIEFGQGAPYDQTRCQTLEHVEELIGKLSVL